jgi:hypothetical protein
LKETMPDSDNTASTEAAAEASAPGAGTVLSSAPQAALDDKLIKAASLLAGTEDLNSTLAAQVSELLSAGSTSPNTRSLITAILTFIRETGPNTNLEPSLGARKHVALYRDIQSYLNKAPADFRKGFGTLLRIIADQKKSGVFGPRYLFRYVVNMSLPNAERRALELLFQALVDLSVHDGRATALTQVDLRKVGELALTPDGAQRLNGFFAS